MVVVGFNATPSGDVLLAPMEAERLALFWNALGWVLLGPPEVIILLVLVSCFAFPEVDWWIDQCVVWSGAG
jgi:hypothetical protein